MYKVDSMALSYVVSQDSHTSYKLYVFPDKYWSWYDGRPAPVGISALSINFDRSTSTSVSTFGSNTPKVKIGDLTGYDLHKTLITPQLHYLLETKWLRPQPIKAYIGAVGLRIGNVVEVKLGNERVAVYLDQETYLPFLFSYYSDDGSRIISHYEVADYREAHNILVPHKIWLVDHEYPMPKKVEINPAYDPMIFSRTPNLEAGAEQWRISGSIPNFAAGSAEGSTAELSPNQIAKLVRNLESSEKETSDWAIRELIYAGKQVIPALTKALQSDSHLLRYRATIALEKIDPGNSILTQIYTDLLRDSGLTVQERQGAAFAMLHTNEGISKLVEFLLHNDKVVRRCVIFALDELTERSELPRQLEKAIPAIRQLLKDKDQVIHEMAEEVLRQIGNRFKH